MTVTQAAAILGTVVTMTACAPAAARAQQPVASFDQLDTRLKVGDTIWVTDAQHREVKGTLRELSARSLRLDVRGVTETVTAAGVSTIRTRAKDSLRNGALWGALIGFASGAALRAVLPHCAGQDDCVHGAAATVLLGVMGGAAGAGIGVAVDAATPGPMLTIYQAPSGTSGRLAIAPFASPRGRGVRVAIGF